MNPSPQHRSTPPGRAARLAWRLTAGHRLGFLAAVGAMLAGTLLSYLVPLVGSVTIDHTLGAGPDSPLALRVDRVAGRDWLQQRLWLPGLLMVGLTVLAGGFSFLKGKLAAMAADGIARALKDRLYAHLQRLPARYHDQTDTGDLVQRCTSDVETLRMALSTQVVDVSHALILMGTALPLMAALDARMAAASFALVGPIVLFGYFYFSRVRHRFLKVDEAEGRLTAVVQENLTGLRVVRAFSRQQFEIGKFSRPNDAYRDEIIGLVRLMAWYWSASDFAVLLQNGLVLGLGLWLIDAGELTVGTLFAFLMLLNLLLWPVRQMGRTLTELGKSVVAIGRIQEILDAPEEPAGTVRPAAPARGHIVVEDLHFAHQEGVPALRGVSLEVLPGRTLAILGPSGSGKSTLLHLLLRLYDYDSGSIRLDGHELRDLDRQWCRAQFGAVMQEPFLFSRSIDENIRLGRPAAQFSEVLQAARVAHIHETIDRFPSGYQTLVGERGVTLSGGQRQRVAIARALLREAPVLLLDDALSAVDTETEEIILKALRERHGKLTTLVIAHRLGTLAHADSVVVLDQGRVIQSGTHAELVAREGLYRRLWEIQNLEGQG